MSNLKNGLWFLPSYETISTVIISTKATLVKVKITAGIPLWMKFTFLLFLTLVNAPYYEQ